MKRVNAAGLVALASVAFAASEARAQRLFESDGIELRGTARIVEFAASTGSVNEDLPVSHSLARRSWTSRPRGKRRLR